MNKKLKIVFVVVMALLFFWVLLYFYKANARAPEMFKTDQPFYTSISTKIVATGSLNPEKEIELKPQISGIVDAIFVEEGDLVAKGDLIAKIRIVPNEQSLNSANSRFNSARLSFDNANTIYKRNKVLYNKGVISKQDFENSELSFEQARESLIQAQNDYQIIKKGSISGGNSANTSIVAQITGTVLEIPVRVGDQVIQSNNFNEGTTIATVANMSNMIFEGTVDESEVGKLKEGEPMKIVIGALDQKAFPGQLIFIAPKGISDAAGAVQFTIKADVEVDVKANIRAGYSANAEIDIESKDSVFSIKESLVQFDRITEMPFVEVKQPDATFKRQNVELGLSDGINVEIKDGLNDGDEIKIWNQVTSGN